MAMVEMRSESYTCELELTGAEGPVAPATLLGSNLEMVVWTSEAMLSDRLQNAKFCGPADPKTGLALGWKVNGSVINNTFSLIRGWGLAGGEAQMIQNGHGLRKASIVQTNVVIKAGETLELELWAMARHHPMPIEVSLFSRDIRRPSYASARITVDTTYWKRYVVQLTIPCDDAKAIFCLTVTNPGTVGIDQIHLRPLGQSHVNEEVTAIIRRMRLPTLRFPGGIQASNYYWRHGTGPLHLRPSSPDCLHQQRLDYDFGTDEYLQLCHDVGMSPFIVLSIGVGTPQDAGEWANYCREWYDSRGYELPVIYFQVGNEQYHIGEMAHLTADMYVEALKAYVPLIRAAYPKARIISMGEPISQGAYGKPDTAFRETVLREAQPWFDVMTLHRYKGQWFELPEEQMRNVAESVDKVIHDIRQLIADCRAHGSSAKIALTEWNYWMQAAHWDGKEFFEPDDAQHGLFYAGVIHELSRLSPDMELSTHYHLLQTMGGMIRNERGLVSETSLGMLMRLYRPAYPGKVLPLQVTQPGSEEGIRWLDALALGNDQGTWLFLCNRSSCKGLPVSLEAITGKLDEMSMLRAADLHSPLMESTVQLESGRLVVPPLSVIRIHYSADSTVPFI